MPLLLLLVLFLYMELIDKKIIAPLETAEFTNISPGYRVFKVEFEDLPEEELIISCSGDFTSGEIEFYGINS